MVVVFRSSSLKAEGRPGGQSRTPGGDLKLSGEPFSDDEMLQAARPPEAMSDEDLEWLLQSGDLAWLLEELAAIPDRERAILAEAERRRRG